MTQSPITVTYSLEEILLRLEGKIDKFEENFTNKVDKLEENFNDKIDKFEEIFNNKIDKFDREINEKIDKLDEGLTEKIDKLDERVNKLEIGQTEMRGDIKALDEKFNGLNKRLDNQEFINRGVLVSNYYSLLTIHYPLK